MFAQDPATSDSMEKERLAPDTTNETHPGGVLKKGLDCLTRIIERKVDRQVLAAQLRANDISSESLGNTRQL